MKISDEVKILSKARMLDMAEANQAIEIALEIRFGSHAFDTHFEGVRIEAMHDCIQDLINDGELKL